MGFYPREDKHDVDEDADSDGTSVEPKWFHLEPNGVDIAHVSLGAVIMLLIALVSYLLCGAFRNNSRQQV